MVSDEAARLADLYLQGRDDREIDEDCLKVKKNRTIVNQNVSDNMGKMEQTSMSPGNVYIFSSLER